MATGSLQNKVGLEDEEHVWRSNASPSNVVKNRSWKSETGPGERGAGPQKESEGGPEEQSRPGE